MNLFNSTSANRAYLATVLCTFAQIQPYGWTSHVRWTLGVIVITNIRGVNYKYYENA